MTAKITCYPVGNGDMTLIELESGRMILVDMHVRAAADDPDDDPPDVMTKLLSRLKRDSKGRLYIDVLLLSHPDEDHCLGLQKHFHLGPPEEWSKKDDKILIREQWSSPMVFRRASKLHKLCDDASAFNSEARRRVELFRKNGATVSDGDRILVLGEDENGKTDDLTEILIKVGNVFSRVNGTTDATMEARLLAPHPKSDDETEEEARAKNRSSTIINFMLTGDGVKDAARLLTGGDAEVAVWERLWDEHSGTPENLSYDILRAPHHCSWHSLSYDGWKEKREDAEVCEPARNALSQAKKGAVIVASCDAIKDDDNDPPCIRAKREYEDIAKEASGKFVCVGEPETSPHVVEFEIGSNGARRLTQATKASLITGGAVGRTPLGHG